MRETCPSFREFIRREGKAPTPLPAPPPPPTKSYKSEGQVLAGHHLEQSTSDQLACGPGYSDACPLSLLCAPVPREAS